VEIIDFLRAARRQLLLVILLPVLSMASTAGLLLLQPPDYTATAIVDPPALVGGLDAQYTGAQGVNQFVAAFQATASGPVVRRAVAAQAKVTPGALNDGLVVAQRGTSSSLSVDFTSRRKDAVVPVLNGVTTQTLRALFESQVQSAQSRVDAAKKAVDDATAAIGEFTTKNAMADPQKAYEAQLSRVNALVQQQASMRAAGNAVGAAAMGSPIAAAKDELAKFGPILTEYSTLTTARDTAVQGLDAAEAKLSAATVQLANADPTKIVFIGGAHVVDRVQPVVATTAAVGAAAFLLALVLVLILEVIARGRASRQADLDAAEAPRPDQAGKPGLGTAAPAPAATVTPGNGVKPGTGAQPSQPSRPSSFTSPAKRG
jgi:Chain length determinant protein